MLSLLITHIIITTLCLWSGVLFYKFFPTNQSRPIIYFAISGLILITALTQILALFFPINIYSKLVIPGILVLLSIYKRKRTGIFIDKIKITPSLFLFFMVWAIILLINAGPIIMDDTESYHIQSIKWLQEYGSVPGLVNLHERFGFNSSWFSSVALFSFPNGTTGGFTVLNSVLSMWFCYWLISSFNRFHKEGNIQASFIPALILIISLLIWPLTRGNAASANYDFITTVLVLILFSGIFLSKGFSPSIEWIMWPVYLFTIRIINFPLLLLTAVALIFFIKQRDLKNLLWPVVSCILLLVPFVIRNVIIAGYPFYPSTSFDLTNVDWKPDPQTTGRLVEYIKYYNRVSTTYLEIGQTKALGPNWIPSWFKYLFLFDKILLVLGLTGIVFSITGFFISKNKNTLLLIAIPVIWLICWFIVSPDPRFVYGVLLFGIYLLANQIISFFKQLQLLNVILNGLVIVMIIAASYYFFSKLWKQPEYRNWLSPSRLPQPPVREIVIDGIRFHIPEPINNNWNARCYGTRLPCLYRIDPGLQPRGRNIADGFRLKK